MSRRTAEGETAGEGDRRSASATDQRPAGTGATRYYVDNVEVRVATERVQYLDADGKLITESLKDYSRKTVRKAYASLDDFLTAWNDADRKQAILEELAAKGVFLDELAEQVGRDYDAFDLVCHVAFDQPPLTRQERAEKVQEAQRLRQVRRQGPRRPRCPAREIRRRRHHAASSRWRS